MKEKPMN